MPLDTHKWRALAHSIIKGECTPFLGSGVAKPPLPVGTELARELAGTWGYPLDDIDNLSRVTEYYSTISSPQLARDEVLKIIKRGENNFLSAQNQLPPENYRILADFGLRLYITTNYDSFMERALAVRGHKPLTVSCLWNSDVQDDLGPYPARMPDEPVVYHLHGHSDTPSSLVLTQSDYVDFTVNMSLRPPGTPNSVLWHVIRPALIRYPLIFIGYSLEDWNFRVLMRYLLSAQQLAKPSAGSRFSIQFSPSRPGDDEKKRAKALEFLQKSLQNADIEFVWMEANEFLKTLRDEVEKERVRTSDPSGTPLTSEGD